MRAGAARTRLWRAKGGTPAARWKCARVSHCSKPRADQAPPGPCAGAGQLARRRRPVFPLMTVSSRIRPVRRRSASSDDTSRSHSMNSSSERL